jgi:phage FluMu gp28-like protein
VKAAHASAIFWGYTLRAWSSHNGQGSFFNHMLADAARPDQGGRAPRHDPRRRRAGDRRAHPPAHGKLKSLPAIDAKARQDWLDELRATCPDEDDLGTRSTCASRAATRARC